jgi:hypothetical protein
MMEIIYFDILIMLKSCFRIIVANGSKTLIILETQNSTSITRKISQEGVLSFDPRESAHTKL